MVILYCLLINYILIMCTIVIAHSFDHEQNWNIFSVISATEESQVTSSDAKLNVHNDPLGGKNTR